MTVLQFLKLTFNAQDRYQVRPAIFCKDGFRASIQGGTDFHYCWPREHINQYEEVELGFPSAEMPSLAEYAEDPSNLLGTIYGNVPLEKVEDVISSHGGIDLEAIIAHLI